MKKLLTIISALLIVTGLKAQKTNVQKETVKPTADTITKSSVNKQINNSATMKKDKVAVVDKQTPISDKTVKKAKITPTTKVVEPGVFKKSPTQN